MEENDKFKDLIERYQILTQPGGWRAQRSQSPLYCPADGSVGDGWVPILEDLFQDLIEMGWDRVLLQVKEKFGGLRFYVGKVTDEMHDRINQAEDEASKTCETCGQPGKSFTGGWVRTLCDGCNERYLEKQKERDTLFYQFK